MSPLPWSEPGWRGEVETWVGTQFRRLGITSDGPLEEMRLRPWSALFRAPSSAGKLYFKAVPPGLEHEVRLSVGLATWYPDSVLPVLAADEARGWMLLPDGGERAREGMSAAEMATAWPKLLGDYAGMQVDCAERVEHLLAMGVPDRRLYRIPELIDEALMLADRSTRINSNPLTPAELQRLTDLAPSILACAKRLAAFGLPETIQHDDLHDGNVLVQDGHALIFDWGDASIAHPFMSLRVALECLAERLGLRFEDATGALAPSFAAYLDRWKPFAPMDVLLRAYEDSKPLALLLRVLTWDLALTHADESERDRDADFIVKLFRALLQLWDSPGGNA